jgi:hypothetical protein
MEINKDQEIPYSCDPNDFTKTFCECVTIRCSITDFMPKTSYRLQIDSYIVKEGILKFPNSSIFITDFEFHVPKNGYAYELNAKEDLKLPKLSQVRLNIKTADESIPLWIIIVAAAGAFLILAIIACIAWRCGVFLTKQRDADTGVQLHSVCIIFFRMAWPANQYI